jgi:glyoxylase-like metal-dependent hydrolase (beta-lactamase superfamily II)
VAEAPAQHPSILSTPADDQAGSSVLAESFITKIKEKFPTKPIRYLVPTHFHSDHAGGARAFAAEGATIVTTSGNQRYFEEMVSSPRTMVPDRLASTKLKARVEGFRKKHTITDGEQTVELIDIGASPHSDEMIAVYLPKQKVLFQGDMFYFDNGARFPPRNRVQIMQFFSRWLKKQDLKVEQIYSVHGRGYATMQDVETTLAASQ